MFSILSLVELPGAIIAGMLMYWGIKQYRSLALERKIRPNILLVGILLLPIIAVTVTAMFDPLVRLVSDARGGFTFRYFLQNLPFVPACVIAVWLLVDAMRRRIEIEKVNLLQVAIASVAIIFGVFSGVAGPWVFSIGLWTVSVLCIGILLAAKILNDPQRESVSLYVALIAFWGWSACMQIFNTTYCSNCNKTIVGYALVTAVQFEMIAVCLLAFYLLRRKTSLF